MGNGGRVQEVHPDPDGIARTVKTAKGSYVTPLSKLSINIINWSLVHTLLII